MQANNLTLLIKHDSNIAVMEHLCQVQGYDIVSRSYKSFPHNNPDTHSKETANANGY